MIKVTIPEDENFYLLDILQQSTGVPAELLAKAMKKGNIKLNGEIVKKDGFITGGIAEIYLDEKCFEPQPEIIYSDSNLMIINKYPGEDGKKTVLEFAESEMKKQGEFCPEARIMPVICNRLEDYAGGLVIVAKNDDAFECVITAMKERRLKRFYRCIVGGRADDGEYLDYMETGSKIKISGNPKDGRPAMLRVKTIKPGRELSMLEIEQINEYPHQICAQMAYHDRPVLGDFDYGNKKLNKSHNARYPAIWLDRMVLMGEAGSLLSYLGEKEFQTTNIQFPYVKTL